ncbi:unnamed protein product [Closterium sp. NIES-53]
MACVSTRYRGMEGDLLWRWYCRDALADSFAREDSQGDVAGEPPRSASEIRNRAAGRERLQRQVARMSNGDAAALGRLFNVCPGVTPAHLRDRKFWTGTKFSQWQNRKPPPLVSREVEKHDRRVLSKPHRKNFGPTFKLRFHDAYSEYPFMKDEVCPFCSSEVWNGCEVQVMFAKTFTPFIIFNPPINCIVPTIVHCVCTKGHWYGLEREEESDDDRKLFHSPAMAVLDNPATGDDYPDERPALTGLDFLLSTLDLDKAARATPDTIPIQKAPAAPVISLSADHVAETSAEPTVDSQSQIPTQTTARTTRLKQATLTFGKPASSTANVNNAPGTSDRPRPRLNINLAELIEGVYDEAIDKLKNHWSTRFPWLIITKTTTGLPAFKCTVCAAFAGNAGKCGRRGRGATDPQTQSFHKHAGTTKHKLAVERQKSEEECGGRQPQIDQHRAAVDSEKMRTVALLDSLLFISRSDAPMGMWVKLVRYLSEKGVQGFLKRVRHLLHHKADAASLLGVLLSHLLAVGVDLQRIAGISTDGANVMMGCKGGLTTRLRVRIPHLVSSHCIAHREALAAKTTAEKILAFNVIDTVIRTVAEHLGRSGPWHQRFMGLQEVFTSTSLELQGIHAVRWISRGGAVLRLVAVLLALIVMLKEWDATLYALVTSYRFHFLLFFIADVLEQLNISTGHSSTRSVHAQIKRTTSHIESRYVDCRDDFGGGVSELLSPFIARHGPGGNREVKVEGIDSDGRPARFKFVLHEDELEEFEGLGTHDGCVEVCTEFAEVIVHQLEHRLGDLNGMSGARLFTPDEYPLERGERNRRCLEWLQSLVTLFKADLTDEILPEKELRMFTSVLATSTKGERSFHVGLTAMLKTPDWRENYPNLVLLWVAVAVLPLSTVECERGFSRQNIIKSWKRGALKDARLGDLMCMSLMDYAPDWDEIVTIWRSYKKRKPQSNAPPPPAGKQHNKKGREAYEEMDVVDLEDEQDAVDSDDDDGFNE